MSLEAGDTLGPYTIISAIGAGGMGEVYRARDSRLQRDVALKVLPAGFAADPDRCARFEREALAAARIEHPHIVSVYDVGVHDGTPFLVSELLDGRTLRECLREGGLGEARAMKYGAQIAEGLAAAHERGIVHRDVKPDNLFVTHDGRVKVFDFGIAKLTERPTSGATAFVTGPVTEAGVIVGTAAYMSPEQVRGEVVDERSDIFSLGAVLFEMVTGQRAFSGQTTPETMTAVLRHDIPASASGSGMSSAVDQVVRHCLEKAPAERFQSARDLAFALRSLMPTGTAAVPVAGIQSVRPVTGRYGRALVTIGVSSVALTSIAWLAATRWITPTATGAARIFTQLTFDSGVESFPKLSADGTSLVYAGGSAGNVDIYLRDVGGRTAINLTADSPLDDTQPALSPDGQQIAFRSERDGGGVFIMGRMGGVPRRVIKTGFNPTWSSDGKQLAVATEPVDARPDSRSSNESHILVVDVVTGATRTLVTGDAVEPAWSPKGVRVAYWGLWQRNQRDIWTVGLDGSTPVRVTDDAAIDWDPAWSPDGQWLYFSSDRGGSMNIWRVRIDEQTGVVTGVSEAVTLPTSWAAHARVGRDGRLVYASYHRSSNIDRVAFDPDRTAFVARPEPITSGSNYFVGPQLSHDGRWLTFLGQAGSGRNVFVSSADGRDIRQVTLGPWREAGAYWANDDSKIAFYSSRSGRYQIFTVNRDGSELRQVSDVPGNGVGQAVWSHSGRWVATYEPVTFVAYLVDATKAEPDRTPEALPKPPDESGFIPYSWSDDDSWLLGEGARGGVILYSLRDHRYRRLSAKGSGGPRWIPHSRMVLFSERDDFFVVDVDSGAIRGIGRPEESAATATDRSRPATAWSLSWDGHWLYRSRIQIESDLWLMTPAAR